MQVIKISPLGLSILALIVVSVENRPRFELLVEQNSIRFEALFNDEALFCSFDLEPGEKLAIAPTESTARLPKRVGSVTETWAGVADDEFLVAIDLWDERKQPILSICLEGDEAEIMNLEALRQRLDEMLFSYKHLSQQLYSVSLSSEQIGLPRSA
jgi:hypothetical protein